MSIGKSTKLKVDQILTSGMKCRIATVLYESSQAVQYNSKLSDLGFSSHDVCMVLKYFDKEFLDPSPSKLLHDECKTSRHFDNEFLEFVLSSHEICTTSIDFDNKFLEFVLSSHEICATSMDFDNEFLEFIPSSHEICVMSIDFNNDFFGNHFVIV